MERLNGVHQAMGRVLIAQRVDGFAGIIFPHDDRFLHRRRRCHTRLARGLNARELRRLRTHHAIGAHLGPQLLGPVGISDIVNTGPTNWLDCTGTHGNSWAGRDGSRGILVVA
ncbi:hypothetical protein D3C87_1606480 [compost metagenome]